MCNDLSWIPKSGWIFKLFIQVVILLHILECGWNNENLLTWSGKYCRLGFLTTNRAQIR